MGSPVVKKLAARASTIYVEPRQGRRVYAGFLRKRKEDRENAKRSVGRVDEQCKE